MPEKCSPEDVVNTRSHVLTRNAMSEVLLSIIEEAASDKADLLRKNIELASGRTELEQAPSFHVPIADLDMFKLTITGVNFKIGRLETMREDAKTLAKSKRIRRRY